jgi:hypothetical protein
MSRSRDCDLFKEYRRKAFDDFCNLLRETRSKYFQSIGYFEYGNPYREIGEGKLRPDVARFMMRQLDEATGGLPSESLMALNALAIPMTSSLLT